MISSVFDWVKKNKLSTFLIVVVLYLIFKNKTALTTPYFKESTYYPRQDKLAIENTSQTSNFLPSEPGSPLLTNPQNRLVVKESYLSLVVKNVGETQKEIIEATQKLGGFMIQSYFDNPQEAASATITIRVPAKKT